MQSLTLKSLVDQYEGMATADDLKEAYALAQAGTAADIARLNLLLKRYEGTDTLHDIAAASRLGFDTPKAAPPADAIKYLNDISESLRQLIQET